MSFQTNFYNNRITSTLDSINDDIKILELKRILDHKNEEIYILKKQLNKYEHNSFINQREIQTTQYELNSLKTIINDQMKYKSSLNNIYSSPIKHEDYNYNKQKDQNDQNCNSKIMSSKKIYEDSDVIKENRLLREKLELFNFFLNNINRFIIQSYIKDQSLIDNYYIRFVDFDKHELENELYKIEYKVKSRFESKCYLKSITKDNNFSIKSSINDYTIKRPNDKSRNEQTTTLSNNETWKKDRLKRESKDKLENIKIYDSITIPSDKFDSKDFNMNNCTLKQKFDYKDNSANHQTEIESRINKINNYINTINKSFEFNNTSNTITPITDNSYNPSKTLINTSIEIDKLRSTYSTIDKQLDLKKEAKTKIVNENNFSFTKEKKEIKKKGNNDTKQVTKSTVKLNKIKPTTTNKPVAEIQNNDISSKSIPKMNIMSRNKSTNNISSTNSKSIKQQTIQKERVKSNLLPSKPKK